jgi:hypothetical protein
MVTKKPSKKSSKPVVEEQEVPGSIEQTSYPAELTEPGTCLTCHGYNTTSWRGPSCGNVASPKYKQRMPETGSCAQYQASRGALREEQPAEPATPASVDSEDPAALLRQLLEQETEEDV